jgi:hypothetical protein
MKNSVRLSLATTVAVALCVAAASRADCPAPTYAPPRTPFLTDASGWTLVNADQTISLPFEEWGSGEAPTAAHKPHILYAFARAADGTASEHWYFRAPAAFRGDQRGAHHGKLGFFFAAFTAAPSTTRDVFLRGGGALLVHPMSTRCLPGGCGLNYGIMETPLELLLGAEGGWSRADTGAPATREEWLTVLANVQDLLIPATWNDGDSISSLRVYVELTQPASGQVRVSDPDPGFGRVRVGRRKRKTIVVANRSRRETLYVRVGALQSVDFFADHADQDIDIPPRHHLRLHVGFVPSLPGAATAQLPLTTSDPDFPLVCLELTGEGR